MFLFFKNAVIILKFIFHGDMQVTFSFHISCVGVSVVDGDITNTPLILGFHTGQCKRTGGCYNELVVAFLRTGGGLKGKKIYTS